MRSTHTPGIAHLGAIRFLLATAVAMFHVWTPVAPDAGRHSVAGFFLISGFLITKIARENYPGHPVAFIANRALRIYPQFIAACLITLLMVKMYPAVATGTYLVSFAPASLSEWIGQLSFATVGVYKPFIPPAWSLNVEIVFYFVIGLLTYDSKKLTLALFLLGLVAAVLCLLKILPYPFYFSPQSDAFMFFAGSLAYFYADRIRMPSFLLIPALCLYGVAMFVIPPFMKIEDYSGPIPHAFLLTSLTCMFVILVILQQSSVKKGALTDISAYLGRMSYPIFLLHWAVAMPFASIFDNDKALVFLASYPALILVSIVMVQLIDRPVERLRSAVRGSATPTTAGHDYRSESATDVPAAPLRHSSSWRTLAVLIAIIAVTFVWPLLGLASKRGVFNLDTHRCPDVLGEKADLYFGAEPQAGRLKACPRATGDGGWYTPESMGVWGSGRSSKLTLAGRHWGRKTLHLDLHISSYAGMGFAPGPQTVIIKSRGVVVARRLLQPGMPDQVVSLTLPVASRDSANRVTLEFETAPPISPSEVGGPEADTRSLGVYLRGLQLRAR